jgi:hypothetical protein
VVLPDIHRIKYGFYAYYPGIRAFNKDISAVKNYREVLALNYERILIERSYCRSGHKRFISGILTNGIETEPF